MNNVKRCKGCGSSDVVADIKVYMQISIEDMYKLTKEAIRKKNTELMAVDWDSARYVCKGCGRVYTDLSQLEHPIMKVGKQGSGKKTLLKCVNESAKLNAEELIHEIYR